MDKKIVFVKTDKGEDEIHSKSGHLSGDIRRALLMVDGIASYAEISKRAAPSLRVMLDDLLLELMQAGFIQDKAKTANIPRMVIPTKIAPPKNIKDEVDELDFTAAYRAPTAQMLASEAEKINSEKLKAEQAAAQARAELAAAQARAQEEAKARALAEEKLRQEAAAAQQKAQQEAERIRIEAERAAAVRAEAERIAQQAAEAARLKAEQAAAQARAELAAAQARAQEEAKARALAEEKLRQEAAAAQQEAERVRIEAERAAAARAEAERIAQQAAEAARLKAEQAAAQARAELAAAQARAQEEAKARALAEEKLRQEAKAAQQKAQQEAERIRIEAERAAAVRAEAERIAQQAAEAARLKAEQEAIQAVTALPSAEKTPAEQNNFEARKLKTGTDMNARSSSVTVLFFDIVGYTKQSVNRQTVLKNQFNQLVSVCLSSLGEDEYIILDTGDGAAIGFMQHPEDALAVSRQFRDSVRANRHQDYPDLKVRIGIHLGPVNIISDMNGQSNMVGDGINDAQRVMSFAADDQIFISRAYYDFVSRLSDEYADMFEYRGTKKDKHKRNHQVYELMDVEPVQFQANEGVVNPSEFAIRLDAVNLDMPVTSSPAKQKVAQTAIVTEKKSVSGTVPTVHDVETNPPYSKNGVSNKEERVASSGEHDQQPITPAESKLLADTQAKAWSEAEQRAIESAKINAERAMQQAAQTKAEAQREVVKAMVTERVPRQSIPWQKVAGGLALLLVLALFVVPMLLPMHHYGEKISKAVTAKTQQPMYIGKIAGRLLPSPRLTLSDITLGESKQLHIDQAQLEFSFAALFSSYKSIQLLDLQGVQINGKALNKIITWAQQITNDEQNPISQIQISHGKIDAENVAFNELSGRVDFDQSNKFNFAKLSAEGGKYSIEIRSSNGGKYPVALELRNAVVPFLGNVVFDELSAKGELSSNELLLSNVDGRIFAGAVRGDARIHWNDGWSVHGTLTAKGLGMQNMNKLLAGDVDANGHFQMTSATLSGLADSLQINGAFLAKQGVINGMDIVETARLRSKEHLPGGRTHYEELSGDIYFAKDSYLVKQLKLNAGLVNATGSLELNKQRLSGRLQAELSMRSGMMGGIVLQLDGASDAPQLRALR